MKLFLFSWLTFLLLPFPSALGQFQLAVFVHRSPSWHLASSPTAQRQPAQFGDFIYCEKNPQSWWPAQSVVDYQSGSVPADQVALISELPLAAQKVLFDSVFRAYQQLADTFRVQIEAPKQTTQTAMRLVVEKFNDEKFDPLLSEFADYFRKSQDMATLQQLFATLWADRGAQSEMPSVALAQCFANHPERVVTALRRLDTAAREAMIEIIAHGIDNQIYLDDNEKLDTDQNLRLKSKLEAIRN